ncbi:MAG: type II toxin-antitoxin system VapB family antitoxin [Deltaproteobacteria bacterium]|nr:type II toxin-antitoxin system VapB family antitoxin [Deltaproteobacteria bacterium]
MSEGGSPMDAPEVRRLLDELSALTRERPGDALRRALSERIERVRREELQRAEAERRAAVLARDVWPHLRRDAAERTLAEPEGHDFDLEGE